MNRSQFNKMIVPGLFSFMKDSYELKNKEATWKKIINGKARSSNRAYEESAYWGGVGLPVVKPEGKEITYDDVVQGPTKRWNFRTYGLGMRISEEAIEDNLYDDVPADMRSLSSELGDAFADLWEVLVHDIYNNGTATTSHTGGDGLALFSASHPSLRGSTWANLLSPAADLSATSLQTVLDNLMTTKDDAGKFQIIKPKYILVHPNNLWKTKELLQSGYDPESPNNAINPIRDFSLQAIVSPYYTDTDAFTVISEPVSPNSGVIAFMRRPVNFKQDSDFETGDFKVKGTARFSVECNKAIGLYHSAGA